MAIIYADNQGRIIRALLDEAEEQRYPTAPAEATASLAFDETTNAEIVAALRSHINRYRLIGGELRRIDGSPVAVPIAPDGEDRQQRQQLTQAAQNLRQYVALNSPTAAQTAAALRVLIRLVLYLARRQLQRGDL